MHDKALRILKNCVVISFFASLLAGVFVPVYTDEVGWRFQERAGFDGVDKMFNDLCGANTLAAPPFFMLPARYFSAFFNAMFADPFYVRLSGVGYALLWAVLLLRLIGRIANDDRERSVLTIIAFGLMGLGVLPLLLVWSRPEQPIILATTAAISVAWLDWRKPAGPTPAAATWWRSIAILFLGIVAISYHMKGLVLIPLFLVCLVFSSQGKNSYIPRIASGALLLVATVFAAHYWVDRFQCPGDPILAAQLRRANLGFALTGGDWRTALPILIGNVKLIYYFALAMPTIKPMSAWLAPDQLSLATTRAWLVLVVSSWFVALAVSLSYLAFAMAKSFLSRRLDRKATMSVVLFGSAIVWIVPQLVRNAYEASFVLPLMMLAYLFAFSASTERLRRSELLAILAVLLGAISIGSEILVALTYGPSLAQAFQQKGYIKEQPYSLTLLGYAELKPDIIGAASKCGITGKPRPSGLLVDDLTYFAFMQSYRPQHRLGVLSAWNGSIADPVAYLRARGSDGIIVGCRYLNDDLRRRSQRQGEFCCLGPPDW
ncbi:hypothetical protein [Rhodoblastus sp.]|uniref:hypothetical protein n=1 Tax=Rhodoblastus sp. TaxID=1962975 RepID=UPI003F94EB0F